ncbi:hypothetical protein [Streptomyces sp. NPDC051561]
MVVIVPRRPVTLAWCADARACHQRPKGGTWHSVGQQIAEATVAIAPN